MQWVGKLVINYLLDWAKDWLSQYFKKAKKKKQSSDELNKKRDRFKVSVDKAFDGTDITKEQREEMYASFRNLTRS